jgi:hypothetical protein
MRKDYFTKYRPAGFTYHADAYCYDCGVTLPGVDPEGNPKHAVMQWEELFTHDENELPVPYPCGMCGESIQ